MKPAVKPADASQHRSRKSGWLPTMQDAAAELKKTPIAIGLALIGVGALQISPDLFSWLPRSPSATESPAPSAPEASSKPIALGDCLISTDGVLPAESSYGDPSRPAADIPHLSSVSCAEPHQLEVLSFTSENGLPPQRCTSAAVDSALGDWGWSDRFIGAPVDRAGESGLCAVGLRSGSQLETTVGHLSDEADPMMAFGACARNSQDVRYEAVPDLFLACKRGYLIHYQVLASTSEVALGVCENYHRVLGYPSWSISGPIDDHGIFRIECLYELK